MRTNFDAAIHPYTHIELGKDEIDSITTILNTAPTVEDGLSARALRTLDNIRTVIASLDRDGKTGTASGLVDVHDPAKIQRVLFIRNPKAAVKAGWAKKSKNNYAKAAAGGVKAWNRLFEYYSRDEIAELNETIIQSGLDNVKTLCRYENIDPGHIDQSPEPIETAYILLSKLNIKTREKFCGQLIQTAT